MAFPEKLLKTIATRCAIFSLKFTKNRLALPGPTGGSAPPDPLAAIWGLLLRGGREGRGEERKEVEREGRDRMGGKEKGKEGRDRKGRGSGEVPPISKSWLRPRTLLLKNSPNSSLDPRPCFTAMDWLGLKGSPIDNTVGDRI